MLFTDGGAPRLGDTWNKLDDSNLDLNSMAGRFLCLGMSDLIDCAGWKRWFITRSQIVKAPLLLVGRVENESRIWGGEHPDVILTSFLDEPEDISCYTLLKTFYFTRTHSDFVLTVTDRVCPITADVSTPDSST